MSLVPVVAGVTGVVLGAGLALAWNPPTIHVRILVGEGHDRPSHPHALLLALPYGQQLLERQARGHK